MFRWETGFESGWDGFLCSSRGACSSNPRRWRATRNVPQPPSCPSQVEASPELVLKERLDGSGSRRAKPVWAELLQALGEPGEKAYDKIYKREDASES